MTPQQKSISTGGGGEAVLDKPQNLFTTVSKDLDTRLSKASCSCGRLSKRVWQSYSLRLSTKIQVYRLSSFPPSCTVQRPGFSIGSRSGCWSSFTNAACAPSLPSNGKTTCKTKNSSREPACPAYSPSYFKCSCAGQATSQRWKRFACPEQSSSASSKKESAIVVLQESITKTS